MLNTFSRLRFVIIASLLLLFIPAANVLAHGILVSAEPAPNTAVPTAPTQIRIRFSEPIYDVISRIEVYNDKGERVDNNDLAIVNANKTELAVTLPPLPDGIYQVNWKIFSTVDGHDSNGRYTFAIGTAELTTFSGSVSGDSQWPSLLNTAARWFSLAGSVLWLGLFTFLLFVWRPSFNALETDEVTDTFNRNWQHTIYRLAWTAVTLSGVGLILLILGQMSRFNLLQPANAAVWVNGRFGMMWLVRLALVLLAGGSLLLWRRHAPQPPGPITRTTWQWWLAGLALGFALLLPHALISHSAALLFNSGTAVIIDYLHLTAASIWVGGLMILGVALWRIRPLPSQIRAWLNLSLTLNFSALAAFAVGVLIVSGGYLAWQHVGSWAALFGTAYGLTLLGKLSLAGVAFAIAGVNLIFIKPRLEATFIAEDQTSAAQTQGRLRQLVRLEAIFALLVLLGAGLLTELQRGQTAPLLGQDSGALALSQNDGDWQVNLNVTPARVGPNRFDIFVTEGDGRTPFTGDLTMQFTFLGRAVGTTAVAATPLRAGYYRVEGDYINLVGPWQIETRLSQPGQPDIFIPYRVAAGLSGALRPQGTAVSSLERVVTFLSRSGGLIPSLALVILALAWGFMALRAAKREWQLAPLLLPGVLVFLIGSAQLNNFYRSYTPAIFTANPILPDTISLSRGQALYAANCAACHGDTGRGD
ncbi:MAG TPA: hypothetical protein ENK32_06250, partial [Anaerolineae bacterium]|nr:hypothetical protein [Anaerolineae bacterium]